jgi:hypothetical protein
MVGMKIAFIFHPSFSPSSSSGGTGMEGEIRGEIKEKD